eukprot:7966533-Pyramimonas_sp.AAC.1
MADWTTSDLAGGLADGLELLLAEDGPWGADQWVRLGLPGGRFDWEANGGAGAAESSHHGPRDDIIIMHIIK